MLLSRTLFLKACGPVEASKQVACAKTATLCAIWYAGYMDIPASLPEDRSLLIQLFGLCLAGDAALHTRLVDALLDLSAVEAECRVVGTAASLGPGQPPLANVVAEAICGIKIQVCHSLSQSSVPQTAGTRPYIGMLVNALLPWFATEQVKALQFCTLLGSCTLL